VDHVLKNLSNYGDKNLSLDLFLVKATSKAVSKVLKAKNINVSRITAPQTGKEKTILHY